MSSRLCLYPLLMACIASGSAAHLAQGEDLFSDELPEQVQQSLGVRDSGSDALTPLERAIEKADAGSLEYARAISVLAQTVLTGPPPLALIDKILPTVSVADRKSTFQEIPGWKYGSHEQRLDLFATMWRLVESTEKADPAKASELAKAYLLLAALNDFRNGWTPLALLIEQSDHAKSLLKIPDEQYNKLKRIVEERKKRADLWNFEVIAAGDAIDRLSGGKGLLPESDVTSTLTHLDKAMREGPKQQGYAYDLIWRAWLTLNLVRTRHSDSGEKLVREQLEQWDKNFGADPNMHRWIGEALTKEGPPPGKMVSHVEYNVYPDGTIKPVETRPK